MSRLALVGGVVRDQLLHQRFGCPWTGSPDLDWVVEECGRARHRAGRRCADRLTALQQFGAFGTVASNWMASHWISPRPGKQYPAPAENPVVQAGTLIADLVRRDFTINAMALDLVAGELIDLHQGQRIWHRVSCVFCMSAASRTTPPG